jgi:translation initiation factor 5B
MTRESIDMLKESFREELTKDDWRLVVALKTQYEKATGETILFGDALIDLTSSRFLAY